MSSVELVDEIRGAVSPFLECITQIRRTLHQNPELSRQEVRTTQFIYDQLRQAGLSPQKLSRTGLICDIYPDYLPAGQKYTAFRADIDALPIQETTELPFSSIIPGISHSCGHDIHTTVMLGAALVSAELAKVKKLTKPLRFIFQPAEEVQPGGAIDVIDQAGLQDVEIIYALHSEPKIDAGRIGTRIGPITSASDLLTVTLHSNGGHTSRPHLTGDLVFALGQVITQVPAILDRRLDPRSGVNLTWGSVQAGNAPNAIPITGTLRGTLRCLDVSAWETAADVLHTALEQVVAPFNVELEVDHFRGVPPVDNDARATANIESAAQELFGKDSVILTEQSLGGEDFAWYLTKVPGAMFRLGTRTPGGRTYDIHQGDLIVDERAIEVGLQIVLHLAFR